MTIDDLYGLDHVRIDGACKEAVYSVAQWNSIGNEEKSIIHASGVQEPIVSSGPARHRGNELLQVGTRARAGPSLNETLTERGLGAGGVLFQQAGLSLHRNTLYDPGNVQPDL